jgi:hypothetical protein
MQATISYTSIARSPFPVAELEPNDWNDVPTTITRRLFYENRIQVAAPAPHRFEYLGETPIAGESAIARWLALYDRALQLRANLSLQDPVAIRNARRAVRSFFLYEHQLTSRTRRRARTILWQRDHQEMPTFVMRTAWTQCRCWDCQPALWIESGTLPSTFLQTA